MGPSRHGRSKGVVIDMKNSIAWRTSVDIDEMRSIPVFTGAGREVGDFQKALLGGTRGYLFRM
jgi:hypothetical protein